MRVVEVGYPAVVGAKIAFSTAEDNPGSSAGNVRVACDIQLRSQEFSDVTSKSHGVPPNNYG